MFHQFKIYHVFFGETPERRGGTDWLRFTHLTEQEREKVMRLEKGAHLMLNLHGNQTVKVERVQ